MKRRLAILSQCFAVLPLLLASTGCWDTSLPARMPVYLPTQSSTVDKIEADLDRSIIAGADTGPQVLANTTWNVFGTSSARITASGALEQKDKDEWFVGVIYLGDKGEILKFELGDIFYYGLKISDLVGPVLITDAAIHDSAVPGTYYIAESYGENDGHDFGLTAFGRYFIGAASAGESSLEVTGKLSPAFDRFDGIMTIRSTINPEVFDLDVPASDAYQITVYAVPNNSAP